MQPVADLVGVRVTKLVESGQGLYPRVLGGIVIVGGVVGIAEPDEGCRLVVAVAQVPEQAGRASVAVARTADSPRP